MSTEQTLQQLSKVHEEVLSANEAYAADFGEKANLALPPARQFAILTCMDARLDPAKYAGAAGATCHRDAAKCMAGDAEKA